MATPLVYVMSMDVPWQSLIAMLTAHNRLYHPQSQKYLVSITSPKRSLIPDLGERERGWTWDVPFDYLGTLRTPTGSVIMNFSERDHYVHDCHQQRSAVWG